MENMQALILQLTRARKARRWTQQDLAAALGVSQPVVASMEAGKVTSKLPTLEKWAVALGYTLDWVLTPTTERGLGEVAVFTSHKGGVGKQSLVINLAACLAAVVDSSKRVLLLDFDLNSELSLLLGTSTALANGVSLDESTTYLSQLNLWVGLSSVFSSHEESLTADTVADLLASAKKEFDYVIVNGPSVTARYKFYQKEVLGSEHVIVVTSQYVPGVYGVNEVLRYLQDEGVKASYIINQVEKHSGDFSELDVRRVLSGFPCIGSISYSAEWLKPTDKGTALFSKHIPEINAELYAILSVLYGNAGLSQLPEPTPVSKGRARRRRVRRVTNR